MSFQLSFIVRHLKHNSVGILSAFNNMLLISRVSFSQLFIYSSEGHHVSTIRTEFNDTLMDATWTPRGYIVYTTLKTNKVMVITKSGKVNTTHTHLVQPKYLSVSNDDVVYLAVCTTGVYQSRDDGISWSLVFQSANKWCLNYVIKVNSSNSDYFWTIEENSKKYNLRVYSMDRRRNDSNLTSRDIKISTAEGKQVYYSVSRLFFDGEKSIFLIDIASKTIHVLSANGQYQCQLDSYRYIKKTAHRLAVDMEYNILYIGQGMGTVEVFKLNSYNWSIGDCFI